MPFRELELSILSLRFFSFLRLSLSADFSTLLPGSSQSSTTTQMSSANSDPSCTCISKAGCAGPYPSSGISCMPRKNRSRSLHIFCVHRVAPVRFRSRLEFFAVNSSYHSFDGGCSAKSVPSWGPTTHAIGSVRGGGFIEDNRCKRANEAAD